MGQRTITKNSLFYGDNLDIMRQYMADESVDLIYLDPPFNSSRNYNVLYKDESGVESESQIVAFEDTWHWSKETTEPEFFALQQQGDKLADLLTALVKVMGRNPMTAYLVMMASRLLELHRVLKPTGCLYLHCDPTASHYLKMILDMIFGAVNFQNELVWKRTTTKSDYKQGAVNWGRVHDVILFYYKNAPLAKDNEVFHQPFVEYTQKYIDKFYCHVDENGKRYSLGDLTAPGAGSRGHPQYEFLGVTRYWRYSKKKMEELLEQGRIIQTKDGNVPRYLDEIEGVAISDIWEDIGMLQAQDTERLGYPTQKPLALLERIIQASSKPGDIVLDPFCGCGTAIHAAQKLGRTWIGIDITRLATTLIKSRLYDAFGIEAKKNYDLIGEPTTLTEAQHLATQDRYQFQWWGDAPIPVYRLRSPRRGIRSKRA